MIELDAGQAEEGTNPVCFQPGHHRLASAGADHVHAIGHVVTVRRQLR
jgi:hypothetical protein